MLGLTVGNGNMKNVYKMINRNTRNSDEVVHLFNIHAKQSQWRGLIYKAMKNRKCVNK